ncbi:LOW QUALITY PROTEIN: hypothetical protein HZS_2998 [Henneguya salminicola]|nr:LOW QUALITY PROTEIN: hypothetical protein HZS_2998 [Henneguya salminicola]
MANNIILKRCKNNSERSKRRFMIFSKNRKIPTFLFEKKIYLYESGIFRSLPLIFKVFNLYISTNITLLTVVSELLLIRMKSSTYLTMYLDVYTQISSYIFPIVLSYAHRASPLPYMPYSLICLFIYLIKLKISKTPFIQIQKAISQISFADAQRLQHDDKYKKIMLKLTKMGENN